MSKEEDVEVRVPQAMADHIGKQRRFRYYRSLDDFVCDAIRRLLETWKEIDAK